MPVELTSPPVSTLPPVTLAVALTVVATTLPTKLTPYTAPVALIRPAVRTFPPVILPLTLSTPVTYMPVLANTATLLVPETPTVILALTAALMFEVPLLTGKLALLAATPVN